MITVQFDVDGVLADFTGSFLHTAETYYPGAASKYEGPGSQMEWATSNGVDLWDERTWTLLKQTPWWWASLKPCVGMDIFTRIARLTLFANVYFVTNRMHDKISPVEQTAVWLRQQGIPHPAVICTGDKRAAARLLGTDFSIEDKYENAEKINDAVPDSYLLDRPYNQGPYPVLLRVPTVAVFLDIVEKAL